MNIQQIAQSNIFFFVTTISVVVVSLLLVVALIQIIRILRNVKEVSETLKTEGKNIVQDISSLRSNMKEKGQNLTKLATITGIASFIKNKTKTKMKKTK